MRWSRNEHSENLSASKSLIDGKVTHINLELFSFLVSLETCHAGAKCMMQNHIINDANRPFSLLARLLFVLAITGRLQNQNPYSEEAGLGSGVPIDIVY